MTSLSARLGKYLLVTSLVAAPLFAGAEVIFEENFDDQPDWHSAMHSTDRSQYADTHVLPAGWYSVRQDPAWAPSVGHPDRHESIEILAANVDKARGGAGKSFVSWRDYYDPDWLRWNSDSILAKYFPEGYDEVYVEFYITFDPNWTPTGTSKLMRISSWSGGGSFFGYGGGRDNGPVLIYDYRHGDSSLSNRLSFRGGPWGENYTMRNEMIDGLPRSLVGSGDFTGNWRSDIANGSSLTVPMVRDKLSGGYLDLTSSDAVTHQNIFGRSGEWTKVAIYVKMNSAPGVKDGAFKQWVDDVLILESGQVMWVPENERNVMPKWNVVSIGGNDFWRGFENSERREEWYAIDDLVIRSTIPERLSAGVVSAPPMAPSNISVD